MILPFADLPLLFYVTECLFIILKMIVVTIFMHGFGTSFLFPMKVPIHQGSPTFSETSAHNSTLLIYASFLQALGMDWVAAGWQI